MSSVNLKRQKQINSQMGEVMDDFDRFEFFFATNWKKIVIVAVIAVLAVAAYCTYGYFEKRNSREAASAYLKAENIAQINEAVAKYDNAPAWIYIKLASLYLAEKNYTSAAEALKKAAVDTAAPEMQWRAQLNLAYLDELQNKNAEAADAFAQLAQSLRQNGAAGYAVEAYFAAGRNYIAAKDNAKAAAILTEGRSFLESLPQQEAMVLQSYSMAIIGMLAEMPAAAK